MCVRSLTSLSSMEPEASVGHLSQTFLLEEKNGHGVPQAESKSDFSIYKRERNSAVLWPMYHITEMIRLYCETFFPSRIGRFTSFRRIFLFLITVQVDFVTNSFINLSKTMATRFATSLEWRQLESRQFSNSSSTSWDSSFSSSTTQDEDELSVCSTSSKVSGEDDEYVRAQSEELLTPASFIPTNLQEDADEWGHFMDFQEFESLATMNNMADPFQSLSKTFLRRRGAKVSVCKLEQLQEVDSFITENE